MTFDSKNFQKEITDLRMQFAEAYKKSVDDSYRDIVQNTRPGEVVPGNDGKIHGEERSLFEDKAAKIQAQAFDIIDKAKAEIKKEMSEAPDQAAVNTITLLATRQNVAPEEIRVLVESYGDNYQTYNAIRDIAERSGIHDLPKHPLDDAMQTVNGQLTAVGNMNITGAETRSSASESNIKFCDWWNENMV